MVPGPTETSGGAPARDRGGAVTAGLDLSRLARVHVVGAGGAGMGAIASVLKAMGHAVTGSDLKESQVTERLRAEGVPVAIGHDPANLADAEVVAISSAISAANPEVRAARAAGVPVATRSQILPAIASVSRTVAVAGTHGKTTTSSMLALVLVEAGLRPSFIIGGDLNEIGTGGVWDTGDWFVIEADESDRTFLALDPDVAVVTSVEPDHLETYGGDPAELEAAFESFLGSAGTAVVCADDPVAARLARSGAAVTYGTGEGADYRMTAIERSMPTISFDLDRRGERLGRIELPTPGLHNARNAAAAAVAALTAGAPFEAAAEALSRFGGVARRFEFRGAAGGVDFVDDYAHLPGEVEAALDAARDGGEWDRIVCVFQPHRYSRTAALGADFARSFAGADQLVVTEIYAAGEAPRPGVSSKIIVDAVLDARPQSSVTWLPRLDDAVEWLQRRLRPGDLCLTLGAGDLTGVPDAVMERLQTRDGGALP